jgi:NDP-4-keto-2,6-dideoxyhexose 3-C-methyltransferase
LIQQIASCRVCGNGNLVEVLDLGVQALTGIFPKTRAQSVTSGPLRLVKCSGGREVCGLLQLQHNYDSGEMYGDEYGYRSGLNASMVAHLQQKVRSILGVVELRDKPLIIDIGSNDSTTLRAYPADRCTLVGVDPTGEKFRRFYPGHVELIPDFFSAGAVQRRCGDRKALVITSFSMFYDLERPMDFMREICELLDDEGIWVLEQSYMPTMLMRNSYDTVCHEHLEYYGLAQIKWMADRVGLKIIDVEFNDINGGSFSVVVAKSASQRSESAAVVSTLQAEVDLKLESLVPYREFAKRVAANRVELRAFLDNARKSNRTVVGLGASTKGNVILQYCGVTELDLRSIGEVNPDKFGSFTPGSLLPICPEQDLLDSKPDYVLILPWHFRSFFERKAKPSGSRYVYPLPNIEVV